MALTNIKIQAQLIKRVPISFLSLSPKSHKEIKTKQLIKNLLKNNYQLTYLRHSQLS